MSPDSAAKPLFIVGNKRSGTSQLVRLLNLHPRVFVSHESDIVWILYQFHQGRPYERHPWDSDLGMRHTLESCGRLLQKEGSRLENFLRVQGCVMEKGNPWLAGMAKTKLRWVGDKKPFQHTDPRLTEFIHENLPGARFLHVTRHPCMVAASSSRFNQTADGDFWLGLSLEEKLERWAFHEEKAAELARAVPGSLFQLRYEDLGRHTETTLARILEFLNLEVDRTMLRRASQQTYPLIRAVPVIRPSEKVRRIAAGYGYRVDGFRATAVFAAAHNAFWKFRKRLTGSVRRSEADAHF